MLKGERQIVETVDLRVRVFVSESRLAPDNIIGHVMYTHSVGNKFLEDTPAALKEAKGLLEDFIQGK